MVGPGFLVLGFWFGWFLVGLVTLVGMVGKVGALFTSVSIGGLGGGGGGTGFGLGRFGCGWGWGFSSFLPMGGLGGWSGFLSLSPRFGEFSFPKYFSIVFFLSNWVSVWVWVFICSWVFFFAKGIGFEAIADWVWFGYELD